MSKCPNCGQENDPGATFCAFCGFNLSPASSGAAATTPPPQPQQPSQPQVTPSAPATPQPAYSGPPAPTMPESTNAPIILGIGIGSLVFCGLLGPVAWIMGQMERNKVKAGEVAPNAMITVGWVLGMISTGLMVLGVGLYIIAMFAAVAGGSY